jgi:hypothetical protein
MDSDLPPDLAELERRLADRRPPVPPADLRRRVLAAVRRASGEGEGGFLRFVASVAAAALLAVNLSMSVANNTDWHLRGAPGPDEAGADSVRELVPELSEREARRQAVLLRARSQLTPGAPSPTPTAAPRLLSEE